MPCSDIGSRAHSKAVSRTRLASSVFILDVVGSRQENHQLNKRRADAGWPKSAQRRQGPTRFAVPLAQCCFFKQESRARAWTRRAE
jgi:hypothetical protein